MIKRRFYKVDHGDKDDPSGSSSSSSSSSDSDSEVEVGPREDDAVTEVREYPDSSSTTSGYESEDSSVNEFAVYSAGSPVDEDDDTEMGKRILSDSPLAGNLHGKIKDRDYKTAEENDSIPADALAYILQCKSVFKCRICPRIVCLNEGSLKTHLKSKLHIRSEKLLNDGRLKSMLNSDGEVEDQETAAEMNARIVSMAQDNSTKKKKGEKKQGKRSRKKKTEAESSLEDAMQAMRSTSNKKRRK